MAGPPASASLRASLAEKDDVRRRWPAAVRSSMPRFDSLGGVRPAGPANVDSETETDDEAVLLLVVVVVVVFVVVVIVVWAAAGESEGEDAAVSCLVDRVTSCRWAGLPASSVHRWCLFSLAGLSSWYATEANEQRDDDDDEEGCGSSAFHGSSPRAPEAGSGDGWAALPVAEDLRNGEKRAGSAVAAAVAVVVVWWPERLTRPSSASCSSGREARRFILRACGLCSLDRGWLWDTVVLVGWWDGRP